jgi:hypothetical protein
VLRRRVSVDDVVCSQRAFQRGSGRPGRIVYVHEAVDALTLTDNRNLLLPHLITHVDLALRASGPDAVYYATRLRGASNEKAGRELEFRPRPLEWI